MTACPLATLNFEPYLPFAVPIAVGAGVGLVILTLFSARRRRAAEAPPPPPPPLPAIGTLPAAVDSDRSDNWEVEEESFANRRSSVRREGPPVKVIVSSQTFRGGVESGYVLDRSTGGLRVALTKGVTPGSTMQVRAENAPDTTPWVTVIVRNCRNAGQHFELGCEFDKTPPWNVLLLFG